MELSKFVETNGLSYGEAACLTGYNRTTGLAPVR
jgi:hypothetical protein